jgi:hypothetical protein
MATSLQTLLHPASLIRQKALREGIFGPSRWWKLIAVVVFGSGIIRRFLGKQPQHLGTEKLVAGQSVTITAIAPVSRRQRRVARQASP